MTRNLRTDMAGLYYVYSWQENSITKSMVRIPRHTTLPLAPVSRQAQPIAISRRFSTSCRRLLFRRRSITCCRGRVAKSMLAPFACSTSTTSPSSHDHSMALLTRYHQRSRCVHALHVHTRALPRQLLHHHPMPVVTCQHQCSPAISILLDNAEPLHQQPTLLD